MLKEQTDKERGRPGFFVYPSLDMLFVLTSERGCFSCTVQFGFSESAPVELLPAAATERDVFSLHTGQTARTDVVDCFRGIKGNDDPFYHFHGDAIVCPADQLSVRKGREIVFLGNRAWSGIVRDCFLYE